MTRLVGVELQDKWKLPFALTKVKGIGWPLSLKILKELKLDVSKKIAELSPEDLSKLTAKVEEYPVEGELVRRVKSDVARLKTIGSYRGIRHARSLPVRGQRTRTNARTKRGKRKTVGAFKKEALAKTTAVNPGKEA